MGARRAAVLGERQRPQRGFHGWQPLVDQELAQRQFRWRRVGAVAEPREDGRQERLSLAAGGEAAFGTLAITPSWAGLEHRRQQDNLSRLEKLRRKKKLTDTKQHELQRLGQDRAATPSVAMFRTDDAA